MRRPSSLSALTDRCCDLLGKRFFKKYLSTTKGCPSVPPSEDFVPSHHSRYGRQQASRKACEIRAPRLRVLASSAGGRRSGTVKERWTPPASSIRQVFHTLERPVQFQRDGTLPATIPRGWSDLPCGCGCAAWRRAGMQYQLPHEGVSRPPLAGGHPIGSDNHVGHILIHPHATSRSWQNVDGPTDRHVKEPGGCTQASPSHTSFR
jgi:hypothetical protein